MQLKCKGDGTGWEAQGLDQEEGPGEGRKAKPGGCGGGSKGETLAKLAFLEKMVVEWEPRDVIALAETLFHCHCH